MPVPINDIRQLNVGDIIEDCRYWPCIVLEIIPDKPAPGIEPTWGQIKIDPLVYTERYGAPKSASFVGYCDIPHCGVRKLTDDEVVEWIINGPADVDNKDNFAWWNNVSKKLQEYMAQPDPFAKLVKRNPKAGKKFKAKPRQKSGKYYRK